MNCLNIVQQFRLTSGSLCENTQTKTVRVDDYYELQDLLSEYGYDIPKHDLDAKINNNSITEDVLVNEDDITLVCDDTKVKYSDVQFVILVYCNDQSVIRIKDEGEYCQECFEKMTYPPLETIQTVLKEAKENPFKGLSVSKKIQYILSTNLDTKLTSTQVYEKGKPWEVAGKTPKNTIAARCSTLSKKGHIQKEGKLYYL